MNRFSRIRHHVDMGDVKKRCLEENLAKKNKERQIEKEKILREKIYNSCKSNWREDILDEGMTTSAAYSTTLGTAEGDGTVTTVDAIDASSYSGTINGLLSPDDSFDGNTGSVIRASGTGEGHGGFNVGGNYLAFQGTGTADAANTRFAVLNPIDSTKVDTLQIKAIVGNDSNGGEDPDEFGEELYVMYKTPAMDHALFLNTKPDGTISTGAEDKIIPLGAAPNADLNDYSISIPDYARAEGTQFILIQPFNSGVGFDHYGITNINFKRKAPVNVFVPLDDPSAISFISVGTNEGDPKKRKKKINDQLEASDKYTKSVMGSQFPGQGTRIDGDDPFRSTTVTSDEDIKASPIGSDEVKKEFGASQLKSALGQPETRNNADPQAKVTDIIKSGKAKSETGQPQTSLSGKDFSTFSADAATAEPEVESETEDPEVITTRQSTIATDPEGNEIDPKPVEAGAVQGADATNLDQEEPTDPEPTEPEPIDPDQEEAEKEAEKEADVEDKSEEELNQQLDDKANALQKLLTMRVTRDLDGFKNLAKVAKFAVQGFVSMLTIIDRLNPFTKQNTEVNTFQGGLSVILNSLDIAVSVMDGKITKSNPTAAQIETYKNSILPDLFKSDSASYIPISDIRHEYADDNIYVERINGKAVVRDNTSGIKQNLTFKGVGVGGNYKGFDQVGGGYSQFIIPKDGGEPYIHYYDYNYENINNPYDVAFGGGVLESGKFDAGALMKSLSNIIHQLRPSNTKLPIPAGAKTSLAGYFTNFQDVLGALQTTSTLEGWPPGIHGAALTDITIPLSELPEETQEMIANHPLSWTPDRIANMKEEDWMGEMEKRMEGITDKEDFDETMLAAMKDPDTGSTVDPEYLEKYQRFSFAQYDEKTGTHPDAKEGTVEYDYDRAVEELKKATENPDYDKATQAAYQEYQDILAEQEEKYTENEEKFGSTAQSKVWEKLVGPYYRAVQKASKGGSISMNDPTYQKMINGYKEYEKQVKVLEKKYAQGRDEIGDNYKKLSDEAYAKYEDTFTVRELDDGTTGMVNGGDFKTKNGKIIPGKRTLTAKEQARFQEIRAEYDEVQEYLYSNTDYMDNMYIPYVLYDVKTEFGEYDVSGDSWSPKNKGSGERSEDEPKQPKPDPRSGYAGLNEPIFGLGAKDGDRLAGNYPSAFEQQILQNGLNAILKQKGEAAAKREQQRLMRMYGIYFPLASEGGGGNVQVAHYQPKGNHLLEKYANPNGDNYSLFERLKQKQFFNPNDIKPTFPENPPPQLDPKTGMHPNYGKNAKRYRKLDPTSANAMPPTGDPETDALVDKQRTKPKTKLYDRLKKNIRKDLTRL